jgi:transposase
MPYREFSRAQVFLMPPALDEFIPAYHPARFVAEFVEALDLDALAIKTMPEVEGRPSYPPQLLLACWLYGFMTRVRASRQLERACHENVAFMWLTGFQRPDHNTLWRFYQANRDAMQGLFKKTVRLAVRVGLVDFALQAVDGTKIPASAAQRRSLDHAALTALLERLEASIASLEAQNAREAAEAGRSWRLPPELAQQQRLCESVRAGLERLAQEPEGSQVNLTDPDAQLMKGSHGYLTGYNAQAVADGRAGVLVAVDVDTNAADSPQLVPLLQQTEQTAGQLPDQLAADGGYYSGRNVAAAEAKGVTLYAPPQPPSNPRQDPTWPYHRSHFTYDPATDTFRCPTGGPVTFSHTTRQRAALVRVYRARGCPTCPVRSVCTQDPKGRTIQVNPWDQAVETHRRRMATAEATAVARRRSGLIEPIFGIVKEQLGLRRFLLRRLAGVRAEWQLTATAYNLRKLYRLWWQPQHQLPMATLG